MDTRPELIRAIQSRNGHSPRFNFEWSGSRNKLGPSRAGMDTPRFNFEWSGGRNSSGPSRAGVDTRPDLISNGHVVGIRSKGRVVYPRNMLLSDYSYRIISSISKAKDSNFKKLLFPRGTPKQITIRRFSPKKVRT